MKGGGEDMTGEKMGFTTDELDWRSWLRIVDVNEASAEQITVLEESNSRAKTSEYYLTLIHDTEALRQRSRLFNAVMYGRDGLSRAERELSTVAVSRINGCPYCASVHSRLFIQLAKKPEVIQSLFDKGVDDAELPSREWALVEYAAKLTRHPTQMTAADLEPLRTEGFSDLEILDATHAIAMFAWANRLMQTLGEPVAKAQK
jgi:uncharacterized peroxidase-related enzyme